ncbi:MAG: LysR family transcriptional regulator [Alkalibacterium sp.]|nr:LysR family transcriptional regulator [Alkalibacterium sp.]
MEFRVLNYFLAVAQEGTISSAAETLHLTQPTLSKQLKELEEELGVKLFERGNREILLTEEGTYLVNRGKEIQALLNNTTANIRKSEIISGEISIGGGETEAMRLLSITLSALIKKNPDIKVNIYSGNSDDVLEKIDKGLLDFGLVIDPVEKLKYEYVQLPFADQWGLLVNRNHSLAENTFISPSDLINTPLLISNQSQVDNQLAEWLGKNIDHYNVVGTYNLLYNASLMVQEGLGSALCINGIINTAGTNLKFIELTPSLTAKVNLVWKKNRFFSTAANAFLAEITKNLS